MTPENLKEISSYAILAWILVRSELNRATIAQKNTQVIEQALDVIGRAMTVLERIETRLDKREAL
ncbi:hypothetical protein [Deinococcus misasensis]|uniref:hypothetical protein n=1 Tax=Deinococcus misasensis TaxID=392413 RepID=UPI0012FC647C|nr:hypothetical protein [Deinococcus misasensis]